MDAEVRRFVDELYAEGLRHDAAQPDRELRRRNIGPEAAALLAVVVQAMGAARVLEIGTSNGYSTLWLADAVRPVGGRVLTVDPDADAQRAAAANLAAVGLDPCVELRCADGGEVLAALPDGGQDVVLLDAHRPAYAGWCPHPVRVLRPGGLLVVDNVLSHPEDVAPFLALVDAEPALRSAISRTDKGQLLAVKSHTAG
jgi:predicted O-methyltransferase YrrM